MLSTRLVRIVVEVWLALDVLLATSVEEVGDVDVDVDGDGMEEVWYVRGSGSSSASSASRVLDPFIQLVMDVSLAP